MADISSRNLILKARAGSLQRESVDLSQMPDIFEYEWDSTTETYKVILKDGYDVLEVNDLIAANTTVNGLTITYGGSKFYSPVSGEESIGIFHPLNRATPSAPDATTTTATTTNPATLDLSSLIPVGTTWVEMAVSIALNTALEVQHKNGNVWDYDFGAHNGFNTFTKGLSAIRSSRPAMVSAGYVMARAFGKVKIGASRKLYYGMSATGDIGDIMDIYIRGYYI